jgi:hypothetical protein
MRLLQNTVKNLSTVPVWIIYLRPICYRSDNGLVTTALFDSRRINKTVNWSMTSTSMSKCHCRRATMLPLGGWTKNCPVRPRGVHNVN